MRSSSLLLRVDVWLLGWLWRRLQPWETMSPRKGAAQELATHQLRELAQQLGMRTVMTGIPLNGLLLLMTANDVFVQRRYPAIAFFIYLVSTVLSHLIAYMLLLRHRPFAALATLVGVGEIYLLTNIVVMREVGLFLFSLLPLVTPALVFSRRVTCLMLVALFAGLFLAMVIEPTLRTSTAVRTLAPSMVIVIALSSSFMTIRAGIHRSQYEFARLVVEREKEVTVHERLEAQRRAAEEASYRKTQFLAMMNHELRTPLESINGFTTLLLNNQSKYGLLTARQEELLMVIQDSGKHLRSLIDDVLDLAKIESGKIKLTFAPVDLVTLLQGVVVTMSVAAAEKSLTITLDLPSGPLPHLWGGEKQVRQIILNLVSNAVKFTEQGGVTIRAVLAEDKQMLQVSVTDTGIGIALPNQERIWEEFQQIDNNLGREYSGTGLGLPIAKKLVEQHGGQIWLVSIVECGATFFCTFPVAHPSLSAESAVSHHAHGQARCECSPNQVAEHAVLALLPAAAANTLIVDDDR